LTRDRSGGRHPCRDAGRFALAEEDDAIQSAPHFNELGRERTRSYMPPNGYGPAHMRLERRAFEDFQDFYGILIVAAWKLSASCQRNFLSSVQEIDPTLSNLSGVCFAVRQCASLAFILSASGHPVRRERSHLIRAQEGIVLRMPVPKSILCCRRLHVTFGF
jgi:hypothetical protein